MSSGTSPDVRAAARTTAPAEPRPVRRGRPLLQAADVAVLVAVILAIHVVRFGLRWPTYPGWHYLLGFLLAGFVHLLTFYSGGLYEREPRLGCRPYLQRVGGLMLSGVLLVALLELLGGRYVIPRGHLPFVLVLGTLGVTANRVVGRALRTRREGPPRVLLVGAPDDVTLARSHLDGEPRGPVVVGETGDAGGLLAAVAATRATEVLLLSGQMLDDVYPEPLNTLERAGVAVLQRVTPRDTLLGLSGVCEVAGMPFVTLHTHTLPMSRARFKRCLELAGIVLAAPLLLPLLALTALYIRLAAGPPVLFWQDRVGRDGQVFRMVKFRTMTVDAEEGVGPIMARANDPRVVPACEWLRRTRLDELPQLWNVLRGEMSVVGPRPERPELTARFEQLIPGYARRHEIPPGITGLAQIQGRYATDPEYKLGHDLQYFVNWSPIRDLQILARTVWVVLTRRL